MAQTNRCGCLDAMCPVCNPDATEYSREVTVFECPVPSEAHIPRGFGSIGVESKRCARCNTRVLIGPNEASMFDACDNGIILCSGCCAAVNDGASIPVRK